MSASDERNARCMNAIRTTFDFVHKGDSSEVMERLEQRFLSPKSILESSAYELQLESLNAAEAQMLTLIPSLARYAYSRDFGPRQKLATVSAAAGYLKTRFIGVNVEQFHLLCLDTCGRMISCEMLQQGIVDETPFYLSLLLESVIRNEAKAVVLCHNHPGGTLRPSEADVRCTLETLRALASLNIMLVDHIIVSGNDTVSFRQLEQIPPDLWVKQCPSSKLLRDWVDEEF